MKGGHPISDLHTAQLDRNGEFRRRDPHLVGRDGKTIQATAKGPREGAGPIARRQTLLSRCEDRIRYNGLPQ